MPFTVLKLKFTARRLIPAVAFVLLLAASHRAQSIDLNSPTPVVLNEIAGGIAPLDIGDARSTRFFYTFNGQPGDLEITVESYNLEGDVDIFLAGNMRPLTKVTLYAGGSTSRSSKSVYLRRDEPLILRVQARTPNDAEGTYRIRLGGAFKPAARLAANEVAPGESNAANPSPATAANSKARRVSSVGARIEEPVAEVAREETAATPEPTPLAAKPPANPRPARTRAGGRRTSRAETARRNTSNRGTGDAANADPSKAETTDPATADGGARNDTTTAEKSTKPERARPVRVPRARNNRNSSASRSTTPPSGSDSAAATPAEHTPPPVPASVRLVLVMRDGETFERDMAGIRRVTVENGVLVIVSKNGKTERQPMNAVLRMSIEP